MKTVQLRPRWPSQRPSGRSPFAPRPFAVQRSNFLAAGPARSFDPFAPRPFAVHQRDERSVLRRKLVDYPSDSEKQQFIDDQPPHHLYEVEGANKDEGYLVLRDLDEPRRVYYYPETGEIKNPPRNPSASPPEVRQTNQGTLLIPQHRINSIEEYSDYMKANKYAFGQKYLYLDKYKNISGLLEPNPKDPVVLVSFKGVDVVSEANHRVFKLHFEGQGSLAIGDRQEFTYQLQENEVKKELTWARDQDVEKIIEERWEKFQESQPKPQAEPEQSGGSWLLGKIGSTIGSFLSAWTESSSDIPEHGKDEEQSLDFGTLETYEPKFNLFDSNDD